MKNIFTSSKFLFIFAAVLVLACNMAFVYVAPSIVASADPIEDNTITPNDIFYDQATYDRTLQTWTCTYDHYTESICYVNPYAPLYYLYSTSPLTNTCGPVAGSIVVGFYDRYYPNLIGRYNPGYYLDNGDYYYYPPSAGNSLYVQGTITSLYTAMGTNTMGSGTTYAQFNSGMASFVSDRGYTYHHSSVKNGTILNYGTIFSSMQSGKLLTLFCTGFNLSSISFVSGTCTITSSIYTGGHTMVAYAYDYITFYNASNNVIATKMLLCVATGWMGTSSGWVFVEDPNTTFDECDAVYIS